MSDLSNQLDQMFIRENIAKNKYFLKHLDSNLNLPILTIQNEHSLANHSIDQILEALKHCKNCKLHDGYITLLIQPHTKTIIINEINQSHADFKAFLIENFLKNINCQISFVGGCCRVDFQDDEVGLKFLDQAVNAPNPLKAYVEPENVYQSLTHNQTQYCPQYYYPYGIYIFKLDNNMFQNLYIRKASDDHQEKMVVKPFYPPTQNQQRKQSGQERKQSDQVEDKKRKPSDQVEEKQRKISEQVDDKRRKISEQVDEKRSKNTPGSGPQEQSGPYYVEKCTNAQKVQQSPYVEKNSNSRKVSEQVYVQKHKESKDATNGSPLKKATVTYKRETLIDMFKLMKNQQILKCNPNLQKLNEVEQGLLLRFSELCLEAIKPTRKDSFGTPQGQRTPQQLPMRKASEQKK